MANLATISNNILADSGIDSISVVTGSGTANEIAYWSSGTAIGSLTTATYPSLTELSYVKGVTSAIQTQLNAKQATITLTTTGTSGAATLVGATLNIPQYSDVGFANPMTTLGDIIYGAASGTATRLAGNTTTTKQYLSQTGTGTVSAAPSWATIAGSDITGAALTRTNDTNVTLTLGGSASTSLLRAASLTLGWTGQLSVARGGTGAASFTAGQILYGNGTSAISSSATFTYTPTSALLVNNSVTAATAIARGINFTPTLVAAANNDVLIGLDIAPSYTNGAFTGVSNIGLRVYGSVAAASNLDAIRIVNGSDGGGRILFSNSVAAELASITAGVASTGAGTDDGVLLFRTSSNAVAADRMSINETGTVRLNAYTTNGLVYTSGANGTLNAAARTINGTTFDGSANITITANTTNAITFNNGGAGAASGTTFNGSAARTISYNTIGAQPLLTNPITGDGTEAAGNIAYFTGNTAIAGNASLFWDTTNSRLGVGTNSPNLTIDARGNAAIGGGATASTIGHTLDANARYLTVGGSGANPNYGVVWVVNNTTEATGQLLGGYFFGQSVASKTGTNAGTKAAITAVSSGSGGTVGGFGGELRFATRPDNAANDIGTYTRLTISSTGAATFSSSVTATSGAFTLANDITLTARSGSASAYTYWSLGRTSSELEIGVAGAANQFFTGTAAGDVIIKANGTSNKLFLGYGSGSPTLTLLSTGNVGIGTSSPSSKLQVVGDAQMLYLTNSTDTTYTSYIGTRTDGALQIYAYKTGTGAGYKNILLGVDGAGGGGNVGIGTSSPQKILDVYTTANSSTEYQLSVRNGQGSNSVSAGMVFGFNTASADPDYLSAISSIVTNRTTRAADLTFLTAATGTLVERLRITSGGNVGIGYTSPNYPLQVHSSTSISRIQLTNSSTGTASGDGFQIIADGVNATLSLPETGYMSFETSNAERMRITSGGNVGIGPASPEALLHVNKSTTGGEGGYIFIDNPASSTLNNKAGIRFATNAGATFANYGSAIEAVNTNAGNGAEALTFSTWNGSARSERMRLAASGNLLIGETSDTTSRLVVRKDSAGGRGGEISIVNYAASTLNSSAALNFGLEASTYDADNGNGQIKSQITNAGNSAADMIFSTWNGSAFGERFRIAAAGASTFSSSVTATSFFESSDIRLKTNIKDLDIDVSSICAKIYEKEGVTEVGYIAQDVEGILSSAISKRGDGYLDLSYRQIHTAKIAMLEKRIKELEEQLKNK